MIAFAAGFFVSQFFFRPHQRPRAPEPPVEVVEQQPEAAVSPPLPPAPKTKKTENGFVQPIAVVPNPKPSPTPNRVVIQLPEVIVSRMETEWNELPTEAEAVREQRGWRMTSVNPNGPFYQAGFRVNDLITFDFLQNLTSTSGVALAQRIEHILNRVTK